MSWTGVSCSGQLDGRKPDEDSTKLLDVKRELDSAAERERAGWSCWNELDGNELFRAARRESKVLLVERELDRAA
jgi:hypothetical protein